MPSESSAEAEIATEQRHVDQVYARLDELVERARAVGRDGVARGLLDYTGEIKEEDYRGLFERDVMVDNAARRIALLDAQREGLVFGRLDLREGPARYVGRIGVRDEEQEPLVVDWRAPAASVFYQATGIRPMGAVRRRVLRTRGERVTGVEDELLDPEHADGLPVVGEGALMAALTAARGTHMRDIVATIQREQDEIIRAPSLGATLITGGPGTGKTVVALHRTAYLLYTERERIARGGVLVVGPSGVFMRYIERVLPSLGEDDATLRSLGGVHDGLVAERIDPYDVAHVKGSLRMRTVLARAVRDAPADAPTRFRIFAFGRNLTLERSDLDALRERSLPKTARPNPARRDATRTVLRALWDQTARGEVPLEDFIEDVGERDEFIAFMDAWWPYHTARQIFDRLGDPASFERYASGVLRAADIRMLAESFAAADEPSVQDVPLVDELDALLGPVPPPRPVEDPYDEIFAEFVGSVQSVADRFGGRSTPAEEPAGTAGPVVQYDNYAHILVDEAQDLSPMQWRMLGRRGERASWTIVGDPAQSSWPDLDEAAKARDTALGKRPRRHFQLTTNYRNSAEIFELAAKAIHSEQLDIALPTAVRRTGVEPVHVEVSADGYPEAVRDAVARMLEEVDGTVGVVAVPSRREEVAGWLAAGASSAETVSGNGSEPVADRVSVVTPLATKGLEYDAVVVVDPDAIAGENAVGARTLYVVLTRATQRLTTVGPGLVWPGPVASAAPTESADAADAGDSADPPRPGSPTSRAVASWQEQRLF